VQIAKSADVPVIMDVGGAEGPIPEELLECVTVLSPNESELGRLTGMPTDSVEGILQAAAKVQEMVRFSALDFSKLSSTL
jgi:ribokinase